MRVAKMIGIRTIPNPCSTFSRSLGLFLLLLISSHTISVKSQADQDSQVSSPTLNPSPTSQTATSTIPPSISTTSTIQQVQATSSLIQLIDSIPVSTDLDSNSKVGAFFHLDSSQTTQGSTPDGDPIPVYITISICSGPNIPPYDLSDKDLLNSLNLSPDDARKSTQVRFYVSDSNQNSNPGPDNLPNNDNAATGNGIGYAFNGYSYIEFPDGTQDGTWIGVWPPEDLRGQSGTYTLQVAASTKALPNRVSSTNAIMLDDTDNSRALLSSYNYSINSPPNLTLFVLPTTGDHSISSTNYNSSLCAISSQWDSLALPQNQALVKQPTINQSETSRGIISVPVKPGANLDNVTQTLENQRRLQFEVDGLEKGTNYTAWLVSSTESDGITVKSLYPAIKFLTKSADNCRLVYDVPFCPNVAYSIPIGPSVSTNDALSIINQTVGPNFSNFTTTLNTFPCGDPYFGDYSPVRTCDDCSTAYQNWLCAVTMPRCVDSLSNQTAQSASPSTSKYLGGDDPTTNIGLLPYIQNRYGNDSRQSYIDQDLQAGNYGELLPCQYTCFYVAMSCPNIIQWTCPSWDVTSQVDYGAFADADVDGIGYDHNGGSGKDHSRWGGPTRYIATDAFGNVFCNAMGTDLRLRQENSALSKRIKNREVWRFIFFSTFIASILPLFMIL